jgi:hypothetical protein
MTLTPFVSGDPRVCRRLLAQGGRILFLGDSITQQLESLPCRVFPSIDGCYARDNLSFNYPQTAWTNTSTPLTLGRNLVLGSCRTAAFNGESSGSTVSLSRINAGFAGFRIFGAAGSASDVGVGIIAGEQWFTNTLAQGPVRLRFYYFAQPDGITNDDIRLLIQIGGVEVAASAYINNYAASEELRSIDVVIPQGTSVSGNTIRWVWQYRPSTATQADKVFRYLGLFGFEKATLPSVPFITYPVGEGGASALDYSSNYDDAFYQALAQAFSPNWCFWALGQNSVGDAATHASRMNTAIGRLNAVLPNCQHVLWSTPGNSTDTGWEIGEKELVPGNAAAALAGPNRVHLNTQRMMPSNASMDLGKRSDWLSIADGTQLRIGECYRYPSSGSNYYVVRAVHNKASTTPDLDTTNYGGPIAFTGTLIAYDDLGTSNVQLIGDGVHPTVSGRFVMLQALRGLVYMAAEMGGVFPTEPQVQVGVEYGPLGNDLTGTLEPGVFPAEPQVEIGVEYGPLGDDLTGTAVLADAAQLQTLAAISAVASSIQGADVLQVPSPNVQGNLVLTQGDTYDGIGNPKAQWNTTTDYTDGWSVTLTIRDQDDSVVFVNAGEVESSTLISVAIDVPSVSPMVGCPGSWKGKYDVELVKNQSVKTIAIGACYINEDQTR